VPAFGEAPDAATFGDSFCAKFVTEFVVVPEDVGAVGPEVTAGPGAGASGAALVSGAASFGVPPAVDVDAAFVVSVFAVDDVVFEPAVVVVGVLLVGACDPVFVSVVDAAPVAGGFVDDDVVFAFVVALLVGPCDVDVVTADGVAAALEVLVPAPDVGAAVGDDVVVDAVLAAVVAVLVEATVLLVVAAAFVVLLVVVLVAVGAAAAVVVPVV
jgi:hypothetical protein